MQVKVLPELLLLHYPFGKCYTAMTNTNTTNNLFNVRAHIGYSAGGNPGACCVPDNEYPNMGSRIEHVEHCCVFRGRKTKQVQVGFIASKRRAMWLRKQQRCYLPRRSHQLDVGGLYNEIPGSVANLHPGGDIAKANISSRRVASTQLCKMGIKGLKAIKPYVPGKLMFLKGRK